MRVIAVGATGTIGSAVVAALAARHDVVKVGYHNGDFQMDIASPDSISQVFRSIGSFDTLGLSNKLMGHVNLPRIGRQVINDRGSFPLMSGMLSQEPMKGSASTSMVDAGVRVCVRHSPWNFLTAFVSTSWGHCGSPKP